ncbi:MAG: tyrosine-type recombinase/integrase [Syntrophus sp. (in: bacteria)]
MSLIIHCKACRARIKDHAAPCPACGSADRLFYADYFPDGRRGKRVRRLMPENIRDVDAARFYDETLRAATLEGRKPGDVKKNLTAATVDDLFEDYLTWYKDHRAMLSHRDVESVYNNHLKDELGDVPVLALNRHHFTMYQHVRKATSVSNRTINKELDYFRGFMTWCRKDKNMEVRRFEYERLPCSRPLPIILSPGEVVAIVEAAEPFYAAFFIFLYSLGLRKSEAQHLKWQDVDLANSQIRVIQKGGSYKMLPLNDWATAALKGLTDLAEKPPKPAEYVFASKRGRGNPIQNVRPAIDRACKKAGITKYVHSHLFRHSIATHFMAGGVNIRMIQKFLGHADRSATEFYTHVSLDHLRGITKGFFPSVSTDK